MSHNLSETIGHLLKQYSLKLDAVSDSATLDCEILLLFALNSFALKHKNKEPHYDRVFLRAYNDYHPHTEQLEFFYNLISKRLQGLPIAYIIKQKSFWTFDLEVDQNTLIPRPETETLVETALSLIPALKQWKLLDMGTGSGAIALALSQERENCHIIGIDKSLTALHIAEKNRQKYQLINCNFSQSNWFNSITEKFNLIITNPPYIEKDDPHLEKLQYEPIDALVSSEQGLFDIQQIIKHAPDYLIEPGYLLIEHGYNQSKTVKELFKQEDYINIQQVEDISGVVRLTFAQISTK